MIFLREKKLKTVLGSLALALLGGRCSLAVAEDVQHHCRSLGHDAVDDDSEEPGDDQGKKSSENRVQHSFLLIAKGSL
jgi:hypothetical protein